MGQAAGHAGDCLNHTATCKWEKALPDGDWTGDSPEQENSENIYKQEGKHSPHTRTHAHTKHTHTHTHTERTRTRTHTRTHTHARTHTHTHTYARRRARAR